MRRPRLAIAVLMTLMVTACVRPPAAAPSCGPVPSHSPIPPMVDAPDDEGAQEVQAYGAAHPDEFAGVYFDRENGGRLVARFTACIELHQAALDALLGSRDHVVVLDAAFTEAALTAILDSISHDHQQLVNRGIVFVSAGVSVTHNNVEVVVKSDDPDAAGTLEAYGPPGAVVVDLYPADKPWTQPTEGAGWRLLGVFDTDRPYTVAAAVDDARLATEWQLYGLPGGPPAWDPSREIVIFLSDGMGSTCTELRLDAVAIEVDKVYGEFSDPLQPRACTADLAGGKTFVVAVERNRLPASPFRLQIHEDPMPCEPDCGLGPASMLVDLR